MRIAKLTKKYIIADVYTDWCHWCHKLDQDVFHNPTVEPFLAKYMVCIKVNAEDGGPGEQLAQQYGVSGFPTVLFLDPNGKLIGSQVGYVQADEFMDKLQTTLAKQNVLRVQSN